MVEQIVFWGCTTLHTNFGHGVQCVRKKWPVSITLCEQLMDTDVKEGREQTVEGSVKRILHKNGNGGDLKIGHRKSTTGTLA